MRNPNGSNAKAKKRLKFSYAPSAISMVPCRTGAGLNRILGTSTNDSGQTRGDDAACLERNAGGNQIYFRLKFHPERLDRTQAPGLILQNRRENWKAICTSPLHPQLTLSHRHTQKNIKTRQPLRFTHILLLARLVSNLARVGLITTRSFLHVSILE